MMNWLSSTTCWRRRPPSSKEMQLHPLVATPTPQSTNPQCHSLKVEISSNFRHRWPQISVHSWLARTYQRATSSLPLITRGVMKGQRLLKSNQWLENKLRRYRFLATHCKSAMRSSQTFSIGQPPRLLTNCTNRCGRASWGSRWFCRLVSHACLARIELISSHSSSKKTKMKSQ